MCRSNSLAHSASEVEFENGLYGHVEGGKTLKLKVWSLLIVRCFGDVSNEEGRGAQVHSGG